MRRPGTVVTIAIFLTLIVPAADALSTPTIRTTATGSGPLGGPISDAALLSGGSGETGSIEFELYGPNDPTCEGLPAFTSADAVAGDGRYVSQPFFPNAVGTYSYIAKYSGDNNNAPVTTACGDTGEVVTITKGQPTLVTTASGSTQVGNRISDAALLSGGGPTSGTITFRLYGPDDPTCSHPPTFASVVPVVGPGRLASGTYTTSAPGLYQFTAEYSGDSNDAAAATSCGEAGESVLVTEDSLTPSLTEQASPAITVGEQVSDTAMLSAIENPMGSITFRLFAPGDTGCTEGAIAASTRAVEGNGSYTSDPYTTTTPGVYRFVASYSGDARNDPVSTACAEPSATVVVTPVPPPVLARSFTVAGVSGSVLVQATGTGSASSARAAANAGFVQVTTPRSFPMGSIVDARSGAARITTATSIPGKTQSGVFLGGRFTVRQTVRQHGLTKLKLIDGPRPASCAVSGTARVAARRRLSKRTLARLHAHVSGHFQTEGHYSSASVHGTIWETIDRCDSTLTHVFRGVVVVVDHRLHRKVVLRAGMTYIAWA
jgi:hypothetical protein